MAEVVMPDTEAADQEAPFVRLGDSAWELWPDVVLRSAGFPVAATLSLSAPELACAADSGDAADAAGPAFLRAYRQAEADLSVAMRRFAADPRFREAIAWQNRNLLETCVDKLRDGEPRNSRGRTHELTVSSYIQRYHMKNDSIGFFGPVGWAHFDNSDTMLAVEPGAALLSRRRTYFELWAIDAVAAALAARPELEPWLVARPAASNRLDGRVVRFPNQPPRTLSEPDAELLRLCDGTSNAAAIADELLWSGYAQFESRADVIAALRRLAADGLIQLDLQGPVETFPELTLRRRLTAIQDADAREAAIGSLDDLIAAKDAVSDAAGDATAVADAIESASRVFQRVTGTDPVRRHGAMYAGRTILFEDTVRDVGVRIGRSLLAELAEPLSFVLDSASWLVGAVGECYRQLFIDLYEQASARHKTDNLPLAALLSLATPHLFREFRYVPAPVRGPLDELHRRWARILDLPPGARAHQIAAADIADQARQAFPPAPVPWATAIRHSPDLMIAATSLDAINSGDFLLVLGELHVASNTMESRVFVEQHPDPDHLRQMERVVHGGRRHYMVPPKEWRLVTSRTYPPSSLLTTDDHFWSLHPDAGVMPRKPSVPVAALKVRRHGDDLLVHNELDGTRTTFADAIGEQLSAAIVSTFDLLPAGPHVPRVTIGKLVVSRESWTFAADDVDWVTVRDEASRYRLARAWRAAHDLPERVFCRVPAEEKPVFVDFTSIVFVNLLARMVRRSREHKRPTVTLAEMLPDVNQTWLTDKEGAGYCAELRMIAINRKERLAGDQ